MEERLAKTDGRSADGFESRPGRGVGERDAGPTGGGAMKVCGGGEEKRAMLAVPGEALDGNGGAIDLNDIEGVEFAAGAALIEGQYTSLVARGSSPHAIGTSSELKQVCFSFVVSNLSKDKNLRSE
jgi:hypothetical protein